MTPLADRIRAVPSWQVTLGLALLALGFLIAAQLAAEGPRIRYTSQERSPLIETATRLQEEQAALKAQILDLRTRIQELEGKGGTSQAVVRQLNGELEQARIAAGLIPLTGTGIVLQLEDAANPVPPAGNADDYLTSAEDVRTMVEELWLAGAEAVAVNGERIVTTSAIYDIGGTVLANGAFLTPPYQVTAIGPDDLWSRVQASEGFTDFLVRRSEAYGIRVSLAQPEQVDVPAFAGSVTLRQARTVPASAAPSRPPSARP